MRAKLVCLTLPRLQVLDKTQAMVLSVSGFLSDESLIDKNCHNSRTSNNIDMKLGHVTKLDKRNMST